MDTPQNERQDDGADRPVREETDPAGKVIGRSCAWCGEWMDLKNRGRGRPPRYCSKNHRNRASEARTIEARLGRQLAEGILSAAPVREKVEVEVVREVVREVPAAAPAAAEMPSTAREWASQLDALALQLTLGKLPHYDLRHVWRALNEVAAGLDHTYPGGLDALRGRRR